MPTTSKLPSTREPKHFSIWDCSTSMDLELRKVPKSPFTTSSNQLGFSTQLPKTNLEIAISVDMESGKIGSWPLVSTWKQLKMEIQMRWWTLARFILTGFPEFFRKTTKKLMNISWVLTITRTLMR